jgi:predicted esterase
MARSMQIARAMRPIVLLAAVLTLACRERASAGATPAPHVAESSATARPAPQRHEPIRMEVLDPHATPVTFVMRGSPRGPHRLVFLHGMCGHGLGYAQSFQFHAATKGTLIAPQGDVSCGGVWSKWSASSEALDQRIVDAFKSLGDPGPIEDVAIMGMSQGATRAVALARKYPERYTRLVAMAGPSAITASGLQHLKGAVLMAGAKDRQDLMRSSQRALAASGIRATFLLIPEATHGAMGPTPEKTMGEALDFLWP